MFQVLIPLLALTCCCSSFAGDLHTHVVARKTVSPPIIDGVVESAWLTSALPYDLGNAEGQTSYLIVENYLTMLRLLWDSDSLYVCFVCSDYDIVADMTEHDDPLYEQEICEVMLRLPDQRLLELSVSPSNTTYDAIVTWTPGNKLAADVAFSAQGIRTAVGTRRLDDERIVWTVEMAIPWANMEGFTPETGARLFSNFLRYERVGPAALKKENGGSSFLPMSAFPTRLRGWPAGPSSLRPLVLE